MKRFSAAIMDCLRPQDLVANAIIMDRSASAKAYGQLTPCGDQVIPRGVRMETCSRRFRKPTSGS
jgi:hypothetical protein